MVVPISFRPAHRDTLLTIQSHLPVRMATRQPVVLLRKEAEVMRMRMNWRKRDVIRDLEIKSKWASLLLHTLLSSLYKIIAKDYQ